MLKSAVRDPNPVIFIEHKMLYFTTGTANDGCFPVGKAQVKREGDHITVIATSWIIPRVLKVAEQLESDGVSVEVVGPLTLRPLDEKTILRSVVRQKGVDFPIQWAYIVNNVYYINNINASNA